MAFEGGGFQAINTGSDRDLSKNWKLVERSHGAGLACPTARFNPNDKFYYVFGGGNDIKIRRSKDLVTWESRNMSMATHCIAADICLKYRKPCTAADKSYESCCAAAPPDCTPASGATNAFLAPCFYLKVIILPRQARDEHSKS